MAQIVLLNCGPKITGLATGAKKPMVGTTTAIRPTDLTNIFSPTNPVRPTNPVSATRPSIYRTIGAYKIAHVCRKNGYNVQVIDHINYFTKEQIIKLLDKYVDNDTLILGLSTTFTLEWPYHEIPPVLNECLNEVKNKFLNLKLIYGGYGLACANNPKNAAPWGIIKEYGEDTFLDLANFFAGKGVEPRYTLSFNRDGDPIRCYFSSRDRFDIVNDDFKWHPDDKIMPGEALPIEMSRGCIFKCKFCNHLLLGRGKLDYLRNIELVREEMLYNYENWGTTRYYVICDTFNDTEIKMKAWHRMVTNLPFKIEYTCYIRADLLHRFPDVPHMLKESGLVSCFHGIESFGPGAQVVGKGWSHSSGRDYLPELYNNIWKKEVCQTLSMIAGLPGDTKETVMDWIKWFIVNDMYNMTLFTLHLHNPIASTAGTNLSEFDRNATKYGYTFPKRTSDQWYHPDWGHKSDVWNFIEDEAMPVMNQYNSATVSWQVLQLMQLGVPKWQFKKEYRAFFSDTSSGPPEPGLEAPYHYDDVYNAIEQRLHKYYQLLMQ